MGGIKMGNSIYRDIAERTKGSVYIGVIGPVRTGKSTFIKRFMAVSYTHLDVYKRQIQALTLL